MSIWIGIRRVIDQINANAGLYHKCFAHEYGYLDSVTAILLLKENVSSVIIYMDLPIPTASQPLCYHSDNKMIK